MCKRICVVSEILIAILLLLCNPIAAGELVFNQNFENPDTFVNNSQDINIFRSVDSLFSGNVQPTNVAISQNFTVETLNVTGGLAFGNGYADPQGIGGNYVLGMLKEQGNDLRGENDLLGLSFDAHGNNYLNFRLNVSSIDINDFMGPFNPEFGKNTPTFEINLYDNPDGLNILPADGEKPLDSHRISGAPATSRSEFNWTKHFIALDARNATNGNVTIRIDLVSDDDTRYAALDNFLIVAADRPFDVSQPGIGQPGNGIVPEPTSSVIFGLVFAGALAVRRRVPS